jgi:effector-binding domain-containing protein
MEKPASRRWLMAVLTICAMCALAVCSMAAIALADNDAPDEKEPPTRILLKRTEPRSVAAMRHTGPFDEIPATVMELIGLVAEGGYDMTGPLMVVYYDSPEEVAAEKLRWEVWMPVAYPGPMKKVEEDMMGFRHIDPMFVAYTYHVGPYDGLPEAYRVLTDWAEHNKYKIVAPPVEVYWSDPMTVPEEKLVTEIWFPVEEKKIPGVAR